MLTDNLSHVSAFAAVARHGSFRKAGAELGLSTSAISYAIRGLEERLGVNLINRTTRSVALTDAGQRLLERLQPVLHDLGDALEEMNNFRATPTGTLRLNMSHVAARLVVAPLMARFLTAYPDIALEIVEDDSLADIVGLGFDAGIRFQESIPEDMVAVPIGPAQRGLAIATPDYLEGRPPLHHPNDLLDHNCIRHRFPSGRLYKWEFEKDGTRLEIDVKGRVTVSTLERTLQAALDGIGIGFSMEAIVGDLIDQGRLVAVLEDWCPYYPGFMLYYPRQRRTSPALRAFIDMARETTSS
ncbi:LysR substrate-binding domain-containing protein [Caballeronia sordidicola]|uniref:Transcriptional regulator, LysR family n=1 Tax=Caballeronia sordidicola TaxID=196367 RepID=A0A242MY99_CABSO|nr:LysR substrate-binding domain-containing protein [Caballeronia sordidicola]OTP76292.1 Transcriptional regulator, LysR family [Caballeronia sordidicola]